MDRITVDLISDTATRPSEAMRRAMAQAEVGDEQLFEDPTVNRLVERSAELLGHEAALFLPSGTMCNQIALLVHCRPGDEIIAAAGSHIHGSEGAGAAALAGAFVNPLPTARGIFGRTEMMAAVREPRPRAPRTRVVALEQTTNRGGGAVWPLATVREVADAAHALGLTVHMDGARLLNASVASGVPAREFAQACDSVWLDFAKGLGCPVGAVLCGPRAFIEEAWVWKHRLGGALRQAGVLAAACLYALDHNIDRLAEDHENARRFAQLCTGIQGVAVDPEQVDTNIVFLEFPDPRWSARQAAAGLRARGVRVLVESDRRLRVVTHLDVTRDGVASAAVALAETAREQFAT